MQWRSIEGRLGRLLVRGKADEAWALVDAALREAGSTVSFRDGDRRSELFEFLARATQLAAQYSARARALAWIDALRRRPCADRGSAPDPEAVCLALAYGVHWVVKDYRELRRIEDELRWEDVPLCAWSVNLRLASAISRNRQDEVAAILRDVRLDGTAELYREPYHRGVRLSLLGFHAFERGRVEKSLEYFRRAFRELSVDGTFDARLKRVGVYGHWGKAAFREGKFEASARLLAQAVRAAARCRHVLWFHTFRVELAHVFAHRGEYRRAERLARSVARRCDRLRDDADAYLFLAARGLLAAGGFAVDEGDLRRARRYAQCAARRVRESSHPRLPGYLHLLRGRIGTLAGTAKSRARAHDEFARAEHCFRSFGSGDATGLALLYFHRGHLHIRERNVSATLADALRSMELARTGGFLPARSSSLLLRSQLLLQEEVSGTDRLYEEVLRDLGSVRDPVVLFRVIANLYLYSWELGEQVELTDCHMRQIAGMQRILDSDTFACLYERFVSRPVARRILERTLGLRLGP